MKIRMDFVTNSSSSSFVIALEKKPETVDEFYESIYGDYKYGDTGLLRRLFDDMPEMGMTEEEVVNNFCRENWYYDDFGYNDNKTTLQQIGKYNKTKGKEEALKFFEENKDSFIFCVEYGDEADDMEFRLRDSAIIDMINHRMFSHH